MDMRGGNSTFYCIYLTGKSTMSLILSLQMKLLNEKRLSWMIKTLGRRHSSSCLEASRCCWHFGQYLKNRHSLDIGSLFYTALLKVMKDVSQYNHTCKQV